MARAYPSPGELARAFYTEAARHLEDAAVLLDNGRYAASITSSMKAAELGVKSLAMLENAVGFWEPLFMRHNPLTQASSHEILRRLVDALNARAPGLSIRITDLEKLEPIQMRTGRAEEVNSEYPFLATVVDAATGKPVGADLRSPHDVLGRGEAAKHYNSARELLETLPRIQRVVRAWAVPLAGPR